MLLNSALLQKGYKVIMFFSVFASCRTNKYIQILLLWNLYGPASWNVRKVRVVSIRRPWNSKWYNSSFGARSVSSFSWSFMPPFFFFFDLYIQNILLLLVNNLCPLKRMIFLQHKIASRNLFKCVKTSTSLLRFHEFGCLRDQLLHALRFSKSFSIKVLEILLK